MLVTHERKDRGCSMTPTTVQYTAKAHTTGGRDTGTNPEQLFAAAWSACFIDAMRLAAAELEITLSAALAVDAEVDLCTTGGTSYLRARFDIRMPGLERNVADTLVDLARQMCPYTKATRGNIDVTVKVA
jgi:lipoyl-dependent peroxiredoxin